MSNMSYCRFQNTLGDLRDCQDAMGEDPDDLSFEERLARWHLVRRCVQIASDYGYEAEQPKPKRETVD